MARKEAREKGWARVVKSLIGPLKGFQLCPKGNGKQEWISSREQQKIFISKRCMDFVWKLARKE